MPLKPEARGDRRLLAAGATCAALGIATSVGGENTILASLLTLGGWVLVVVGLHRFGRSGPDRPYPPLLKPRNRKKRRSTAAAEAPNGA